VNVNSVWRYRAHDNVGERLTQLKSNSHDQDDRNVGAACVSKERNQGEEVCACADPYLYWEPIGGEEVRIKLKSWDQSNNV
jgi:hypothetical protein